MAYDASLDDQLFSKEWTNDVGKIVVSVYSYNNGPKKLQIIREIKPRMAVLTHFGMPMWKVKPWEIEDRISDETGTKVIAARDGMVFDLDDVDKLK